jgi:hypothetical protein
MEGEKQGRPKWGSWRAWLKLCENPFMIWVRKTIWSHSFNPFCSFPFVCTYLFIDFVPVPKPAPNSLHLRMLWISNYIPGLIWAKKVELMSRMLTPFVHTGQGLPDLGILKCHFSHCFDFCVKFFCGGSVSYWCNVGNDWTAFTLGLLCKFWRLSFRFWSARFFLFCCVKV